MRLADGFQPLTDVLQVNTNGTCTWYFASYLLVIKHSSSAALKTQSQVSNSINVQDHRHIKAMASNSCSLDLAGFLATNLRFQSFQCVSHIICKMGLHKHDKHGQSMGLLQAPVHRKRNSPEQIEAACSTHHREGTPLHQTTGRAWPAAAPVLPVTQTHNVKISVTNSQQVAQVQLGHCDFNVGNLIVQYDEKV